MFIMQRTSIDQISFRQYLGFKGICISVTSIIKQCPMTAQILKSVDFTKTLKSKYLKNKENIFYASRATLVQKILL